MHAVVQLCLFSRYLQPCKPIGFKLFPLFQDHFTSQPYTSQINCLIQYNFTFFQDHFNNQLSVCHIICTLYSTSLPSFSTITAIYTSRFQCDSLLSKLFIKQCTVLWTKAEQTVTIWLLSRWLQLFIHGYDKAQIFSSFNTITAM